MHPRFQCYCRDGQVWWRLLGRNNRSIARSGQGFADVDLALADAARFGDQAAAAQVELVSDHGTLWRWVLSSGGEVIAVSPTRYGRRLECVRAVGRIREIACTATVADDPMVSRSRLRLRPGSSQALG